MDMVPSNDGYVQLGGSILNLLLTLPLIGAGALVMLFSIWDSRRILQLLPGKRYRTGWRVLQILMGFFLLGYAWVAVLVIYDLESWILILTAPR